MTNIPIYSVVVPAFNEADVLPQFHNRLRTTMNGMGEDWDVTYVNDGSTDGTLAVLGLLQEADPHVAIVNLSRNFGKEAATTAGLDHANGSAIIVLDADLQDPPELIPEMVIAWRAGADMVYAKRRARAGESWLRRMTAGVFYRYMQRIGHVALPVDVGDYRLMSRRALDAVLLLREHHRFMKGIFAWVGFPSSAIPYDRNRRAAGKTKWSYWKLWNFALEGITSYTVAPLKIATYLGLIVALGAIAYGSYFLLRTLFYGNPVPGYPSLLVIVLFMGGLQLFTLGIVGEYLGRIFNETKGRPLYVLERHSMARGISNDASENHQS